MKQIESKFRNQIIFFSTYFILIVINTQCAKAFEYSSMTEWWINTTFLFAFVILFLVSFQNRIRLIYMILAIPASWIIHGILSIPAALVLGILKFDPEHLRTAGEHRAVFILASIPIIVFGIKRSKLF